MTKGTRSPPPTAGYHDDATVGRTVRGSSVDRAPEAAALEYAVPDGDRPAARCPYCDRPFGRERLCRLHVGHSHADELTDAERTEYETAYDAESDDLFRYQLKLVASLVVLFFGFVYAYAIVFIA